MFEVVRLVVPIVVALAVGIALAANLLVKIAQASALPVAARDLWTPVAYGDLSRRWRSGWLLYTLLRLSKRGWNSSALIVLADQAQATGVPRPTTLREWRKTMHLREWERACGGSVAFASTCVLLRLSLSEVTAGVASGELTVESANMLAALAKPGP